MRFYAIFLLASLYFLSGFGQSLPKDSISELDPVVVSASYSPTQSSRTGRNIITIKGEQIATLPVNSVDELLRYLPGLEVQARGPMGVQSDISIRGSTFQQVLVVLDGIRLNDPLTGHFNSYIPIPASEIDRIEILKGASSAVYGTEAVGGVVHIISKTFAKSNPKSGFEAQFTAGEYDFWGVNAGGQWANKGTIVSAGILSNHATGQPQRGTTGFFDLTTLSLGLSQKLNDKWSLGFRSAYDSRDFSAQNFYTTFVSDTATEKVTSWWQHARLSFSGKKISWNTDVGFKSLRDQFAFNSVVKPNDNRTRLFQMLSRAYITLKPNLGITGGVQYLSRQIESNDRGNHSVGQTAFFGIMHWQPAAGWHIDPAIRFDWHERAGFELVPQLNASYRSKHWQFRGSTGRTIRDADFTERFNNFNRDLVPSGRIGNPDLLAESAWNHEIGADFWAGKIWKFSSTLFLRNQEKLIDWVNTPYSEMPRRENLVPTGNYALSKNIWEVNTTGFELDVQLNKKWNNNQLLMVQTGLIWLNNTGNEKVPSLYLSTQANLLVNFNALYQVKKWTFTATGLYKKRDEKMIPGGINAKLSPQYFVLNTKIEFAPIKRLGIFLQVDNIGDTKYSDVLGTIMPGRWVMGGIRWRGMGN